MLIIFLRSIILYFLIFIVIRLTGKRQISELQPFDLIVTLLIADMASEPAADTGIPLLYGVVPILALFLVQQLISYCSLKSEKLRNAICGEPLLVVCHGVVAEKALRSARYTLSDLMEQLRGKDVFALSDVEFAVLETNGSLSVLLKGQNQTPTYSAMRLNPPRAELPTMLIQDGFVHQNELARCGRDPAWLDAQLARCGVGRSAVLVAELGPNGLHVQLKASAGSRVFLLKLEAGDEAQA